MDEATAFLETLLATRADAPTACAGWRCHELVAHLAAGAAEMAVHAEGALSAMPALPTVAHAVREAPFVAMDDEELRARLVEEALRLTAAVAALEGSGLTVPFAGRTMSAGEMARHGRSEAAVHRWDLAGDDDVGLGLLSQAELTVHAVAVLNGMGNGSPESPRSRLSRGGPAGPPMRLALSSPGQPDVVLVADDEGARFELASPTARPTAVMDPATRLLALWGRRSGRPIAWPSADEDASRLARVLWLREDIAVAAH